MIPRLWRSIFSFCILPPRSTCFFLLFYILILLVTSTPCSRRSDIYCTLPLKLGDSEQRLWAPTPLWQRLDLVIVWGVLFANFSFVIYYNGLSFFFSYNHLVLFSSCSFFFLLQFTSSHLVGTGRSYISGVQRADPAQGVCDFVLHGAA